MKKVLLSLALMLGISTAASAQEIAPVSIQPKQELTADQQKQEEKTEQLKLIKDLTKSLCQTAKESAKVLNENDENIKTFPVSCFLLSPRVGRFDLLAFNAKGESSIVSEFSVLLLWTGSEWNIVKIGKTLIIDINSLDFTFYPPEL